MRFTFLFILLSTFCSTLLANGKKTPPLSVSFHVETTGLSSKELTFRQETSLGPKVFEKSPILHTKDFSNANAFASPDDPGSYGVLLQLKPVVANRFKNLTNLNREKYLLALVNGRIVDMIRIDRTNPDDKICIWRDVTLQEVQTLNQTIPKIGESSKDWKKRIKAEKKAAKRN